MSIEWQCDREGVPRLRNSCMAKSKRSNRDHAHQHQYPGLDNEVIAADLQAFNWLRVLYVIERKYSTAR